VLFEKFIAFLSGACRHRASSFSAVNDVVHAVFSH
jgi:hypothetical protein